MFETAAVGSVLALLLCGCRCLLLVFAGSLVFCWLILFAGSSPGHCLLSLLVLVALLLLLLSLLWLAAGKLRGLHCSCIVAIVVCYFYIFGRCLMYC